MLIFCKCGKKYKTNKGFNRHYNLKTKNKQTRHWWIDTQYSCDFCKNIIVENRTCENCFNKLSSVKKNKKGAKNKNEF